MITNKFVIRSQFAAKQKELKAAVDGRYQRPTSTRQAARVTGNIVRIAGQLYPGKIDAPTATVINKGRPSAPDYRPA